MGLRIAKARKKIVEMLFKYVEEQGGHPENYEYIIGYGYDIAEGNVLRELFIKEAEKRWSGFVPDIPPEQIGAAIGVYTGPTPIGFGLVEKVNMGEEHGA